MPGLIDSTEGLCFAVGGLRFENGLGGPGGLTNQPLAEIPQVVFAGAGGLRSSTIAHALINATLAGGGSLSATAAMALKASVGFAGTGGGIR